MLTFGNERIIQQGEDWNLDIKISQSSIEYIPFIVSSQRNNPMWAITVASTKYEKNERYVATWWEDLDTGSGFDDKPLPRFYQTVPQFIGDITSPELIRRQPNLDTDDGLDPPMYALYQYTLTNESIDPKLGHKPYYYVYFTYDKPNEPNFDYECNLRMQFRSHETSHWGSQNYMYQITLVDTIPMADYINQAKEEHPTLDWPKWISRDDPNWEIPIKLPNESIEDYNTRKEASWRDFRNTWISDNVEELYTFIKLKIPDWFQPDIDIDAPVGYIDIPQVILPPTKLQVNNNLRRII